MNNYQREREQQIEEMIPVVGVFTLLFMCIAILNLPVEFSPPYFSFVLVPILIYLLVFRVGKIWQVLLPEGRDTTGGKLKEYFVLVFGIGLVALLVDVTGGTYSNYKFLFLPVILLYSLRSGLAWGAAACGLASLAIAWFAWQASPGSIRNPYLEGDLVIIGIFFLVNWLVAKPYQELINSFIIVQRSEKLAALGEMAAVTAHEIRNPLTTVRGYLQILQNSLQEGEPHRYLEQDEYFRLMLGEIDRVNNIVADMLVFSRPTPPQLEVVDLNKIVNEMGMILETQASLKGVEIEVNPSKGVQPVNIDQNQIKQVILNIAINAVEAMPGGGTVRMVVAQQGERVRLQVADTGPGIPPENLTKVFEPFFTADKEGGTGLGLAISYRIVESHGGYLWVESELGQGTTFFLEFPLAPPG